MWRKERLHHLVLFSSRPETKNCARRWPSWLRCTVVVVSSKRAGCAFPPRYNYVVVHSIVLSVRSMPKINNTLTPPSAHTDGHVLTRSH